MLRSVVLAFAAWSASSRNDTAVTSVLELESAQRRPLRWNSAAKEKCVYRDAEPPAHDERIPFHLHIHKSGGSLFCDIPLSDAQKKKGFKFPAEAKKRGCNMLGDGPCTVGSNTVSGAFANRNWCCADRYAFAKHYQSSLISREIFVTGPPCPLYFVHTIMMRDPIARLVSHRSFTSHSEAQIARWIKKTTFTECWNPATVKYGGTSSPQRGTQPGGNNICSDVSWPLLHGTAIYDNYHIRILGGEDVYFKPLGTIDEEDLERVKRVIDDYEVVVILEDFDRHSSAQLHGVLGWNLSNNWQSQKRVTKHKVGFSKNLEEKLRANNRLDMELYLHTQRRAATIMNNAANASNTRNNAANVKT